MNIGTNIIKSYPRPSFRNFKRYFIINTTNFFSNLLPILVIVTFENNRIGKSRLFLIYPLSQGVLFLCESRQAILRQCLLLAAVIQACLVSLLEVLILVKLSTSFLSSSIASSRSSLSLLFSCSIVVQFLCCW